MGCSHRRWPFRGLCVHAPGVIAPDRRTPSPSSPPLHFFPIRTGGFNFSTRESAPRLHTFCPPNDLGFRPPESLLLNEGYVLSSRRDPVPSSNFRDRGFAPGSPNYAGDPCNSLSCWTRSSRPESLEIHQIGPVITRLARSRRDLQNVPENLCRKPPNHASQHGGQPQLCR